MVLWHVYGGRFIRPVVHLQQSAAVQHSDLPAKCDVVNMQVRHGNHPVHERKHTVVMNWNKQLLPVLQQVRQAVIRPASVLLNHLASQDVLCAM